MLDVMEPRSNEWERALLGKNVQLYSNVLSTIFRPLYYSIHSLRGRRKKGRGEGEREKGRERLL